MGKTNIDNTNEIKKLYKHPIPSTRTGAIFNAHNYPTKINPEAILPFILTHTNPNELIFDGFSGTGVTGLATMLASKPYKDKEIKKYVNNIKWGDRKAILYDISKLACFIAENLINPPKPNEFLVASSKLLLELKNKIGWMYQSLDTNGNLGEIRYTIWSELIYCPKCKKEISYWEAGVDTKKPEIKSDLNCKYCSFTFKQNGAKRVIEKYFDPLLNKSLERRKRIPTYIYGKTEKSFWKRIINNEDRKLLKKIENQTIPKSVPIVKMVNDKVGKWGELYRTGYHHGITHLHHFYTKRNLIAIATAWSLVENFPKNLHPSLKFWISSYNSAHSTLMTRVVCKKGSKDLVVTGGQPASLYISSIPVEKNIILGLESKQKTIANAFKELQGNKKNSVTINCKSSIELDIPDETVDYIFTDPPFGDNIQYSEVNFISEAWLGNKTNITEEIIVSNFQGKTEQDYENLLTQAFIEAYRILKIDKFMTVIFHSTQPKIWHALRNSWEKAGFTLIISSLLDKQQGSFKQVTTQASVKGDAVILLQKRVKNSEKLKRLDNINIWGVIDERLSKIYDKNELSIRTKQRLYSYFINYCLEKNYVIPINAKTFFKGLDSRYKKYGEYYYLIDN